MKTSNPFLLKLFPVLSLAISVSAQAANKNLSDSADALGFENFYQRVMAIRQDPSRQYESLVFQPALSQATTPGALDSPMRLFGEWDPQAWGNSGSLNGDLVFLIGHLEASPTRNEMRKFHGMIRWALDSGFRAIMDPAALSRELRETVRSDETSVIIWSSHGSSNGRVWDSDEQAVPSDAFASGAGNQLKMYVFSNCSGENTVQLYDFAPNTKRIYWEGLTSTTDLFNYLYSSRFDSDLREMGLSL